jgi:hypothetical protein
MKNPGIPLRQRARISGLGSGLVEVWTGTREELEDKIEPSPFCLERTVAQGTKIHFDLTTMDDLANILNNMGPYAAKVTSGELRYIRDNWSRLSNAVKFYVDGKEVIPPWLP